MISVPVTLTTYYPINTKLEGGKFDRKSRRLITLQQHKADPTTYPYCSVAGDFQLWPDGQRISLPEVDPDAVFRVVDTGGHFYGAGKVYRYPGREPLDVCMDSAIYNLGIRPSSAIVYPDDNWANRPFDGSTINGAIPATEVNGGANDESSADESGGDTMIYVVIAAILFGVSLIGE